MKKQLEIKPVLRYNKAKYPRYTDPNPLDDPQALPYPFSKRMVEWAMGVGLLGATACQGYTQEIANTFTFEQTGLPYMPAMFGTGMPDQLSSKEIRTIVLQISKEEGLQVKEEVPWKYSDTDFTMQFPISVFDEEKKIGFAILDYANTERNSLIEPDYAQIPEPVLNGWQLKSMWEQFANGDPEFSLNGWVSLEKQALWSKEEKEFFKLFTKATFTGLSTKEKENSEWLFYKMLLKNRFKNEVSKTFFNKPEIQKALEEENWTRLKQALDLNFFISLLHEFVPNEEWKEPVMARYIAEQQLWITQNPEKQSAATNVLAELKDPSTFDSKVAMALKTLFQSYTSDWKEKLWDIREKYQNSRFNLPEIKSMDYWAEQKKLFVAPISFEDRRLSYFFTEKDLVEKWNAPRGSQAFIEKQSETKEAALVRLEVLLRSYIRWAKLQGQF